VAAYLLRIQKRELYAVTIASTPEAWQENGDQILACHQTDARLSALKKICEHLQVPLTVVRPRDEFQDEVLEPWMAARMTGRRPRTCLDCHSLRIHWLHKKMLELGCGSIATGHYAKIVRTTLNAPVGVLSSNDLEHDQSQLVSQLPQHILSVLELPLSELQRKEVLKIAENFQLHPPARTLTPGHCLASGSEVDAWLTKHVPPIMHKTGSVLSVGEENELGKHEGFHHHPIGSQWSHPKTPDKKFVVAEARWREKDILVAPPEHYNDRAVMLLNCHWGEGVDQGIPQKGFLHLGGGLLDREVLLTPRMLQGAWVELLEGEAAFPMGETLTIYKRRGKSAKVMVTGTIGRTGRAWPTSKIPTDGRGPDGESSQLDKDFNF
jgi:tRNA U34 2-thiouridine synthase MnmA/TrmU